MRRTEYTRRIRRTNRGLQKPRTTKDLVPSTKSPASRTKVAREVFDEDSFRAVVCRGGIFSGRRKMRVFAGEKIPHFVSLHRFLPHFLYTFFQASALTSKVYKNIIGVYVILLEE